MTPHATGAFAALATASAAMLNEHHPADILTQLMTDCIEPLAADAAAILVVEHGGNLALLSSSSHRATEIEMLQTQQSEGPCIDVLQGGDAVSVAGAVALVQRWPHVGAAIRDAGYRSVQAFPMRWHGQVLGGLNIFRTEGDQPSTASTDLGAIGQAFADVATLVVVQAANVPAEQVTARIKEAMAARSIIEQAKGVLAYLHGLDMEGAYNTLLQHAAERGATLTDTAIDVIRHQHH